MLRDGSPLRFLNDEYPLRFLEDGSLEKIYDDNRFPINVSDDRKYMESNIGNVVCVTSMICIAMVSIYAD